MELATSQFHFGHLLAVFGISIIAGILIVVVDGLLIVPVERTAFGVLPGTTPGVVAA